MIDNHIYVIFGASGDLAKRKLVPALYALYVQGQLPDGFAILGVSGSAIPDGQYRTKMAEAIAEFKDIPNEGQISSFVQNLYYLSANLKELKAYQDLAERLDELRKEHGIGGNTIFYLSTPPGLYGIIPENLAQTGLQDENDGWKRVIIEKPFGYDLESALVLKDQLLGHWKEEQLFRIDHYLGKETVQNVMVTRFSNGAFEPLWNRNYIDRVEITAAESIGIEARGGYYDKSGALRDMVQNHLLQVAAITAMEPPSSQTPSAIRNEILKVFQSLRPLPNGELDECAVRGQYLGATIKGETVPGYRGEDAVDPQSVTETYVALKFYIDNWRWGGVPFYVRTGKRLPARVTEVVIHFKPTPHFLFATGSSKRSCNRLILRIQPDEGVAFQFGIKAPGSGFEVLETSMDFHYSELADRRIPSAYERLIHDSMKGDATLFARTGEIIEAWRFLDPLIKHWKDGSAPIYGYPSGSWGPKQANDLIDGESVSWHCPCEELSLEDTHCKL